MTDIEAIDTLAKVKAICDKQNWSTYKLAKESGIPYSSLNNMFLRNTQPSVSTLYKLCKGLNITLSEFFSDIDTDVISLSSETRNMLELYNRLPPSKQGMVKAYIYGLADEELTH